MLKTIPNILTVFRICVVPIILMLMMFPDNSFFLKAATALFLVACVTDFLDGYLARKFNIQSRVGRLLDPIADKILVSAVILILVYQGKADLIPAIAIICREIFVSGLREFLAEIRVSLPVSRLAKVKTVLQMWALATLILGNIGAGLPYVALIGNIALWIASGVTIITGLIYSKASLKHISFKGE